MSTGTGADAASPIGGQLIDVVLEGGGVKGIALVGALQVLEERGYRFNRIAGSSAGAITGTLLATDIPAATMAQILRDVDFTRFEDGPFWVRWLPGKILSILLHNGIYRGQYLTSWVQAQLTKHGGTSAPRTFADLPYRDPDPERVLPPSRRFRLVVTASDISDSRLCLLPWDARDFGRDPKSLRIVDAVRASMSIPFFFRPVWWRTADGQKAWLVDGGMLSNYPISIFDSDPGKVPRWPTFGIKLSSAAQSRLDAKNTITGPLTLAIAMIRTMMGFYDEMHIDSADARARTIFIDTGTIRATQFHLTRAQQDMLLENGRRAATDFLDGTSSSPAWDFARYVARHRTGPDDTAA